MTLSEKHLDWLASREIDVEIAVAMGLYSAKRGQDGVEPDSAGTILVYPFTRNGEEIGAKYRGPGKTFWQKAGAAKKVFFNADVLDDPTLPDNALVITEGEMDCLAVLSAGYPFAVSVPDGAPPARDAHGNLIAVPEGTSDINPQDDDKYSFLLNDWTALKAVTRIIIATDADGPGRRLAAELVRRLDRIRCSFVTYPEGCKDFNDVLVKHGRKAVMQIIADAKPYPVSGVYRYSDLPPEPAFVPVSTGFKDLDDKLMLYTPSFVVVTGFPGQGKSTWTVQMATQVAYLHQWNIGLASFEMRVKPYVTDQVTRIFKHMSSRVGSPDMDLTPDEFMERRFYFIAPDATSDEVHDIHWLLDRMEVAVIRHGVKMFVIDPWNEIEHAKRGDESATEYTGRAIQALKKFGRQYDVCIVVVAHPTKSAGNRDAEELSLYSVSDSSHWANKADHGIVVARTGDPETSSTSIIRVCKVRYQPETGNLGATYMLYDRQDRIFARA
jgi:twinkle protein